MYRSIDGRYNVVARLDAGNVSKRLGSLLRLKGGRDRYISKDRNPIDDTKSSRLTYLAFA